VNVPGYVADFVNLVFVPAGLALIIFSMGLTLTLADFRRLATAPGMVLATLGGQLIAMPLLALAVIWAFRLPPPMAIGLFALAISPAGTTSNALTFLGRGNVALAVMVTALSSFITVFTIPVLLGWALPRFLGEGEAPQLSVSGTILQLVKITVIPIATGMVVRRVAPVAAARLAVWLRPVALIVLLGIIVFSLLANFELVVANLLQAGIAILVLNVAAMGVGLLIGRTIRATGRDAMTIAIEIGVHNATLATFLTLSVLHRLDLAIVPTIYGLIMVANAGLLIRWFNRQGSRSIAEP
jgi:BASS family bile acid:Na+ symporter